MHDFLQSLGRVLPCKKCRPNYEKYISDHPFDLRSRDHLVRWMIDLHNDVNKRLGKPILSYEEAHNHIYRYCSIET